MKKLRKLIPAVLVAAFIGLFTGCDLLLDSFMLYGSWKSEETMDVFGSDAYGQYTFNDDLTYEQRLYLAKDDSLLFIATGTWMIQKDPDLGYNTMTLKQEKSGFTEENLMDIPGEYTLKYSVFASSLKLNAVGNDENRTLGKTETYKKVQK